MSGVTCGRNSSPTGGTSSISPTAWRPSITISAVGDLSTLQMRNLLSLASNAVYAPEGYLLFARDRKLVAQPFDAAGLKVSGDPVTLAEYVVQQWQLDHKTDVSVSNTGLLVFSKHGWLRRAARVARSLRPAVGVRSHGGILGSRVLARPDTRGG